MTPPLPRGKKKVTAVEEAFHADAFLVLRISGKQGKYIFNSSVASFAATTSLIGLHTRMRSRGRDDHGEKRGNMI